MSKQELGNMWQKATKRDNCHIRYGSPDEREMTLHQLGSLASWAFVPSIQATYQQGGRN